MTAYARSSGSWRWHGAALLFDLDGTLIDSRASVLRAWRAAADEVGVPFADFEPYIHGIPADQAFALAVPGAPTADIARWAEQLLVRQAEDSDDVVAIGGALELLDRLPTRRWAIATSADLRLATARIGAAGLPRPRVLVTAEDVVTGKPNPAPYLQATAKLSTAPAECLVFEDAWPGVQAGIAAGMPVVGVRSADWPIESPALDGTVWAISDYGDLTVDADWLGLTVLPA